MKRGKKLRQTFKIVTIFDQVETKGLNRLFLQNRVNCLFLKLKVDK